MDRDEYEDYLVDKAKELLEESAETVESSNRQKQRTAHQEVEDVLTDVESAEQNLERVRKEADLLANRRNKMDNDELEEFLSGESEFHKVMRDLANSERSTNRAKSPNFTSFSDWENRVLITSQEKDVETLADELDRSVEEVKLQLKMLGLEK